MEVFVESFKALTRKQILALPTDQHGDFDLLSVCDYFEEIGDRDRRMAVYELILRSSQVDETVDYAELYLQVFYYYGWKEAFLSAVQWCYAMIAFGEQHGQGLNRLNSRVDLANVYLWQEDFNVGLAMYAQMLQDASETIWLYLSLGQELTSLGLSSLAADSLARALKQEAQVDRYKLKNLIEDLRDEAIEAASNAPSRDGEVDSEVLTRIQDALQLPMQVKDADQNEISYPPQVVRLLETSVQPATAYQEIIAKGCVFIPALIQLAYDPQSESGSAHAIAILRALQNQYAEELKMLTPWLDQADGNWRQKLLSKQVCKIGGYTTQALKEYASNTQMWIEARASAVDALVDRVQVLPALRDELIVFFRTLFTRPEAYQASEEHFIARLVSDSINLDARELYPEILQVYREDRLEPGWIDLRDVNLHWDIPDVPSQRRQDGLYLPLVCKDCGRQREHFTAYILADINALADAEPNPKYGAHILDHEVVCPKCGAVDRYELTPVAHLRIAGPDAIATIIREELGEKTKPFNSNPRVLYFRSVVFGEPMHPLEGLDKYRAQIAANPGDALLHSRMGSLLRILMRYEEALKALRHAYQLAPDDPEVIIRLAYSEHDFGDREAARKLYQKIIDLSSTREFVSKLDDNLTGAMKGIHNLNHNQSSPIESILLTGDGKQVKHPSMLTSQSHAESITQTSKRNKSKRRRRRK